MGWSCRKEAGDSLDAVQAACIASTGSQNTWETASGMYFFEVGDEQDDGAIVGDVLKVLPGTGRARVSGTFRIEPAGRVSKGPAFFRRAVLDSGSRGRPSRRPAWSVGRVGSGGPR